MTKEQFQGIELAMRGYMQGSVHDVEHVYRVLWWGLRLLKHHPQAKGEVVVLACLLHDIGRSVKSQTNTTASHGALGAQMAHGLLCARGYSEETAAHVAACIRTHSHKGGLTPETIEAKILYDADKLDLTGAVGTARALLFGAEINEPFYLLDDEGLPTPGKKEEAPSLYREYRRKLKHIDRCFYTKQGKKWGKENQKTMDAWFKAFKKEINTGYGAGRAALEAFLE